MSRLPWDSPNFQTGGQSTQAWKMVVINDGEKHVLQGRNLAACRLTRWPRASSGSLPTIPEPCPIQAQKPTSSIVLTRELRATPDRWKTTTISKLSSRYWGQAPPDGNMRDYCVHLQRLIARTDEICLPGHGPGLESPRPYVKRLLANQMRREPEIFTHREKTSGNLLSNGSCSNFAALKNTVGNRPTPP